jgi:pimeloyl-ACP methyl ester carboxylesterase
MGAVGPGKAPLDRDAVDSILRRASEVDFIRESFRPWFTVWPREELARSLESFARTPIWAHRAVCEIALWTDITSETTGITAPALVMAGEHDPVYGPAYQREAVIPTVPHATVVSINCGHGLMLERPLEVAAHLDGFLAHFI